MLRWLCVGACVYLLLCASTASADPVTLKPRIEAAGASITLGDIFNGAGDVSDRAIAPSPPAGQIATLPLQVLVAAASAAGLDWTPPDGVTQVQVVHPGGARATVRSTTTQAPITAQPISDVVTVHRGQLVTLTYRDGGISISMRAQAMEDATVGQGVRLTNPSSNRVVLATVTGPGAATASP